MTEKKEEQKERFVVGQIATQTAPAIIDTTKGEEDETRVVPIEIALAKILNNQEELKKLL